MADDGDDRSMMEDDDSVQRIYSKRTNDRFLDSIIIYGSDVRFTPIMPSPKKTSFLSLPLNCIVHSSDIWWLSLPQFSLSHLRVKSPSGCEMSRKKCQYYLDL